MLRTVLNATIYERINERRIFTRNTVRDSECASMITEPVAEREPERKYQMLRNIEKYRNWSHKNLSFIELGNK